MNAYQRFMYKGRKNWGWFGLGYAVRVVGGICAFTVYGLFSITGWFGEGLAWMSQKVIEAAEFTFDQIEI